MDQFPSPRDPIRSHVPANVRGLRSWHRQDERRAVILAITRQSIDEVGIESVSLKLVAAAAGTTVQTIFNIIGNRKQVLGAAIAEYGDAMADFALADTSYPDTALAFAGAMARAAALNPNYMRNAALTTHGGGREITDIVRAAGLRSVRRAIGPMVEPRENIPLGATIDAVHAALSSAFSDWEGGSVGSTSLRANLLVRTGLALAGASCDAHARNVIRWLAEHELLSEGSAPKV